MTSTATQTKRQRVVVIGSGFGGLFTTKALRKTDVDVTLIARTGHHLFQPLLYQVATGILSEGEIAPATRMVLRNQDNARTLLGDVTSIDIANRTVTSEVLGHATVTPYDKLVIAAGAGQSYFGNDQFAAFAPGMKSIDDALELRGRIFGAFELAELADDPADIERLTTFVVVGAGPTGVEMAGQIRELAHRTLKKDFRHFDPDDTKVILLDAAPAVLGNFGEKLSGKALDQLRRINVDVQLNAKVVDVTPTYIEVEDPDGTRRQIPSICKIWAAGVAASPLGKHVAEQVGIEVDRAGRVPVEKDLTLPGHPEVYVIGDMIALDRLPGVAQVAIQGAKHVAKDIRNELKGKPTHQPFHYFDKGSMATVSRFQAVLSIGKFQMAGFLAWVGWLVLHLFYIVGFKNRFTTLVHWAVSFVGSGRSERTVTEQQVVGRRAIAAAGQVMRYTSIATEKRADTEGDAAAALGSPSAAQEASEAEAADAGSGASRTA